MLKQRIITAVILAPLVIAGIFFLPFPAFIAALAAITLIGFWEWTQFVEAKSRVAAMIVPVVSLAASLWFMPTDPQALSTLATSHHIMLMTGGVWWLIASALAITYTQRHMVVRDLSSKIPVRFTDLNPILLERADAPRGALPRLSLSRCQVGTAGLPIGLGGRYRCVFLR